MYNGSGITMICVSGAIIKGTVKDCLFQRNFVGVVPLEMPHGIERCDFIENHLTGILFDKGSSTRVYDCLFMENGNYDHGLNMEWSSALLSSYGQKTYIPAVQIPFIYNNTFVNNYRVISVDEPYECQDCDPEYILNMPVMMNNIFYNPTQGSEQAIYVRDDPRCWIYSRNNCYWVNNYYTDPPEAALTSVEDYEMDPLFSPDGYWLSSDSLCYDLGFYDLTPGVISEAGYSDNSFLDIGYHFTFEFLSMGPVIDLNVDSVHYNTIRWKKPEYGTVFKYLVFWQDDLGNILGQEIMDPNPMPPFYNTYEVTNPDLPDAGLWFGVSAFSSSYEFGTPVFVEM